MHISNRGHAVGNRNAGQASAVMNASSPIEVTLSGIVMLVRLEQFANALSPIEVTLSGM